jgi:hypothetical protein
MRDGSIRAPSLAVLAFTFPSSHAKSLTVSESAKLLDDKDQFFEIEPAGLGCVLRFALQLEQVWQAIKGNSSVGLVEISEAWAKGGSGIAYRFRKKAGFCPVGDGCV